MDKAFLFTLGAAAVAALVTTGGILAVRKYHLWAQENATYFASFAAGVLIAVSFMHLVPNALSMARHAPAWLLAGYFLMHVVNRFLTAFVCDTPTTRNYALGLIPLMGIGLHSFIDGVIYSVGFSVGVYTGGLVALGMVLHEFPEGIVTYALLVRSGFTTRQSFSLAFIAAAATTPLGAAVSYPFIASISDDALGSLVALSAGALIYVGATHLLPYSEQEPRRFSVIAVASGVAIALGIVLTRA